MLDVQTLFLCYYIWIDVSVLSNTLWVMLTSVVRHWLRIHFRKVLTSLLWEMKKAVKTLITFFSFSIKTFFN